ncbi:hypothetical protein MVEN_01944100 [Mycena venus]|uniref:Uncharacterized protein n=1 Tax=Mycena venus TaxID=2733690 RepID=A0A8H7CJR0_9AGAR|nr:hypothetical protein MVEN_01944100 [Mycena venus]
MSNDWTSSSGGGRPEDTNMSLSKKVEEILRRHPTAVHFRMPSREGLFGWLRWTAFTLTCFVAYGHPDIEVLWAALRLEEEGDESVWKDFIRIISDRLNNVLVVSSLLLATASVFITTVPPIPGIINYTLRGPYISIVSAFGLLIGGIICVACTSLVASQATPYWIENVIYRNRACVYCAIMLGAGPIISVGAATLLLAFGMHSQLGIHLCF